MDCFVIAPIAHIAVINEARNMVRHRCTKTSPYQAAILSSRDEDFKHNLSCAKLAALCALIKPQSSQQSDITS